MVVRAVRLGPALEVVALDVAGEALTLRNARHVDQVTGGKQADVERLADLVVVHAVHAELADRRDLGQVAQLAALGLGQALAGLDAELHGRVAVTQRGTQAGDRVGLHRHDADRHHRAVVLEDGGHADLAPNQSNAHRRHRAHACVGSCAHSLTHGPSALARVLVAALPCTGWTAMTGSWAFITS